VSRIPSDVPVSPGARPQQVSRSDFVHDAIPVVRPHGAEQPFLGEKAAHSLA
jgi:hypothetical protein